MKFNKKYNYPKTIREKVDGYRHYSVNSEKLPSVTTILSHTQSEEKKKQADMQSDNIEMKKFDLDK